MILGELVTEEKSNEITAVPEFPASLNIERSVVTADAMSCQKKIVERIPNDGADYVIGLKGNQSALLENVSLHFESFSGELPKLKTRLKDHGRIEKREYRLLTDLSWLEEAKDWKGLRAVGMATTQVVRNGKTATDTRYFISSVTDMEKFAYAVRKHCSVENQLHWCLDRRRLLFAFPVLCRARWDVALNTREAKLNRRMDVIFREDSSRARSNMSPLNLNVLRKVALTLCRNADLGKRVGIQKRRFLASLNPDIFLSVLFDKS